MHATSQGLPAHSPSHSQPSTQTTRFALGSHCSARQLRGMCDGRAQGGGGGDDAAAGWGWRAADPWLRCQRSGWGPRHAATAYRVLQSWDACFTRALTLTCEPLPCSWPHLTCLQCRPWSRLPWMPCWLQPGAPGRLCAPSLSCCRAQPRALVRKPCGACAGAGTDAGQQFGGTCCFFCPAAEPVLPACAPPADLLAAELPILLSRRPAHRAQQVAAAAAGAVGAARSALFVARCLKRDRYLLRKEVPAVPEVAPQVHIPSCLCLACLPACLPARVPAC